MDLSSSSSLDSSDVAKHPPEYNLRPRSLRKRLQQVAINNERPKSKTKLKPKPPPLSKYRRRTANARERGRMQEINAAFEKLRRAVPDFPSTKQHVENNGDDNKRLTKITTLRLAVNYIAALTQILEDDEDDNVDAGSTLDGLESSLDLQGSADFTLDDSSLSLIMLESDGESLHFSDDT